MNYTKYNVEERANKIEQKVTEQVSFADDEIENYAYYLQSLKYEIQEISDQIRYIDEQNLLRKNQMNSERLHQNLQKRLASIHENSIHQTKLRKINFDHSQKVSAMAADFDELINSITKWSEDLTAKKVEPINKKLERAKKKLDKLQGINSTNTILKGYSDDDDDIKIDDLLDVSDDEINDRDENLQNSKIRELENSIDRKKKERLRELESVKKQLGTCITMIENMSQKHKKEKDEILKKLKSNDTNYTNKIKKVNKDYQREIEDLKNKVAANEKIVAEIEKEIDNQNQEFTTKMLSLKKESNIAKSEMKSLNQNANINSSAIGEKSQLSIQLEELAMQKKEELNQKTRLLTNEYETNATLKRELNLKKIEQKLEMRKEARK
ncbi:hypothetical protein M9Y10_024132 [Tritrichomonas musculus]|uniref:Uncharacterized protein n=1 Tax=Tritrichomonas musculus TaxID=1915356 RepID=A0ABR2KXM1_9EUKA